MSIQMPYKKMEKSNRMGLYAKCDCGHEHKFNGNDIDVKKSDSITVVFNDIYTCPKCNTKYNGIYENHLASDVWYKRLSPVGLIISAVMFFGLLFGGYKIINIFNTPTNTNTDINNVTNKELQEFKKWEQKQDKQKTENQKVNNND